MTDACAGKLNGKLIALRMLLAQIEHIHDEALYDNNDMMISLNEMSAFKSGISCLAQSIGYLNEAKAISNDLHERGLEGPGVHLPKWYDEQECIPNMRTVSLEERTG